MEQIIYPVQAVVDDPGEPWDGSDYTDLAISEVESLDCATIMAEVDDAAWVSHPVSCSFETLPSIGWWTVYFMNPDTLAYTQSVQVQKYYAPTLDEAVIFDVFVSLIVVNWILDFVLFFSYLRKKVRKITRRRP